MRQEEIAAIYPLTALQAEMLNRIGRSGQNGLYLQCGTFTLEGVLERDTFLHSWQMLFAAHAILRTVFVQHPRAGAYQVVVKMYRFPAAF